MFAPMMDRWQRNCIKRKHPGYTPPGSMRKAFLQGLNPHPPKPKPVFTGMADPDPLGPTGSINVPSCWPVHGDWEIDASGSVRQRVTWATIRALPRDQWTDFYVNADSASTSITTTTSGNISTGNSVIIYDQWTNDSTSASTDRVFWPAGVIVENDLLNGSTVITYPGGQLPDPKKMKEEQFRRRLKQQITGGIPLNHRGALVRANHRPADFSQVAPSEVVALRLLRGMLNEEEWKRYLRYGFIIVRGESGLVYQIVRNQSHVRVYRGGKKVAELCIYVNGNVPPTDQVIGKKVMVECCEKEIWSRANIHGQSKWPTKYNPSEEELVQLAA